MGKEMKTMADDSLDWENRRLCPDESCIGIIGPDGRCTECGRQVDPVDPDALEVATDDHHASDQSETQSVADPFEADEPQASEAPVPTDDDWQSRQLCPDGNCIGVIGPDGRCKVCGRRVDDKS